VAHFIAARSDAGMYLAPKFCSFSFNPRVPVPLSSKTLQLQGALVSAGIELILLPVAAVLLV